MPIIKPSDSEKSGGNKGQAAFMQRCMAFMKNENRPHDQQIAICLSTYRNSKKRKVAKGEMEDPVWDDFTDENGNFAINS